MESNAIRFYQIIIKWNKEAGMKGFKLVFILISLFFLAVVPVNAGTVTPIGVSGFNFHVQRNETTVFVQDNFSTGTRVGGPAPQKSFANGDSIDDRADSISDPDSTGLGLVLKAGASGGQLTNGAKASAYLETSTAHSNGIPLPYGVQGEPTQQVTSFASLRVEVDLAGDYAFNALLTNGNINDPGFLVHFGLRADYNWSGGVTLYENIHDGGGGVTSTAPIEFIDLDDMLLSGIGNPLTEVVSLRSSDGSGNKISYDITPQILLESTLVNFDSGFEQWFGDIPQDSLGYIGTMENPLEIEATLSEVPIPGSGILLLSGIAALIGYRRRGN
jgi:hypothetical protein